MKKVLLGLAFVAFATVGCKKDYTCNCTVNGDNIAVAIPDAKKSDAESTCDAAQVTYRNADPDATCTLD